MHPMHGVRKELSQRRIMTTSSLSITGDIERASPFKVLAVSKIPHLIFYKIGSITARK